MRILLLILQSVCPAVLDHPQIKTLYMDGILSFLNGAFIVKYFQDCVMKHSVTCTASYFRGVPAECRLLGLELLLMAFIKGKLRVERWGHDVCVDPNDKDQKKTSAPTLAGALISLSNSESAAVKMCNVTCIGQRTGGREDCDCRYTQANILVNKWQQTEKQICFGVLFYVQNFMPINAELNLKQKEREECQDLSFQKTPSL